MAFGSVGADDEKEVGFFKISNRVAHGTVAESGGRTGHCRGMSETGTMVYVIGTDNSPGEFLDQIIFLVGELGGA